MAVTKTHPIKSTLKAAIDYICNPEKTDGKLLVSSYGCAAETADIEFAWTRRHAIDKGTNLGRHLIQAFQPGEVTPEQAHEIGMELAKEILGGKYISENLGRETIDSFNTSENRGTQVSHGLNYQKLGKELMTQDEIAVMDGGKCILQLRGVRPFFSDKYDITQHPNYKYLSDFDKKNAFDVERYMSTRPAIVKPDEPFDIYEIDLSDEDAAAE